MKLHVQTSRYPRPRAAALYLALAISAISTVLVGIGVLCSKRLSRTMRDALLREIRK